MSLFCRSQRACSECGVFFAPRDKYDPWPDLCKAHRDPVQALDNRKRLVMDWARANWETLESQAIEAREAALSRSIGGGPGGVGASYHANRMMWGQP